MSRDLSVTELILLKTFMGVAVGRIAWYAYVWLRSKIGGN